jgi:hypothetical protein
MSSPMQSSARAESIGAGEWVITVGLLALMIGALSMTSDWPASTAFFPRLLSVFSLLLIAVKLASMLWIAFSSRTSVDPQPAIAPAASGTGEVTLVTDVDEDQGNEDEFYNIFSNASSSTWLKTIGWLAAFFVGLYVFGLLIVLPVFTVAYLRIVAKSSWLLCLLYVLGTAGVIYLLFDVLLHLPLPVGIIPLFES